MAHVALRRTQLAQPSHAASPSRRAGCASRLGCAAGAGMPRRRVRRPFQPLLLPLLGLLAARGTCAPVYVSSSVALAGALKDDAVTSVVVCSPNDQARHQRHQFIHHRATMCAWVWHASAGMAVLPSLPHLLRQSDL